MSTASATASPASGLKLTMKTPKSKVVKLRLSPSVLSRFPSAQPTQPIKEPARKASRSKLSISNDNTPAPAALSVEPSHPSSNPSESNATPVPNGTGATDANGLAPPTQGAKKRGIPGPKPGSKRGAAAAQLGPDGQPKPRGKPGPKKKPRLGDANGDVADVKGPFAGVAPISTAKLGPKANQGAINAGLRALDRTGKPTRKWQKKGFQLKTFTGAVFNIPTWRAPEKAKVDENGDVKSDTTGSSDLKAANDNSALPSEKSSSEMNADTPMLNGHGPAYASSPVPAMATPV